MLRRWVEMESKNKWVPPFQPTWPGGLGERGELLQWSPGPLTDFNAFQASRNTSARLCVVYVYWVWGPVRLSVNTPLVAGSFWCSYITVNIDATFPFFYGNVNRTAAEHRQEHRSAMWAVKHGIPLDWKHHQQHQQPDCSDDSVTLWWCDGRSLGGHCHPGIRSDMRGDPTGQRAGQSRPDSQTGPPCGPVRHRTRHHLATSSAVAAAAPRPASASIFCYFQYIRRRRFMKLRRCASATCR